MNIVYKILRETFLYEIKKISSAEAKTYKSNSSIDELNNFLNNLIESNQVKFLFKKNNINVFNSKNDTILIACNHVPKLFKNFYSI